MSIAAYATAKPMSPSRKNPAPSAASHLTQRRHPCDHFRRVAGGRPGAGRRRTCSLTTREPTVRTDGARPLRVSRRTPDAGSDVSSRYVEQTSRYTPSSACGRRRGRGGRVTRRGETLELAVLGLLHEHPLHGYELRKRLNVVLGWGRLLSYGSLYPALQRMLRAGLIREQRSSPVPPAGRPPVAASRRPRITYEVTDDGREHFATLMADAGPAAWEDDTFDVRFAFFGRIDREIRLRILEGRRARLEERLEPAARQQR